MKRFEIIDGMRGYFLVFMLINHLVFVGGYWLVEINHRQLAFVEDAQGFVFLSGLLAGMVYARKMLQGGYRAGQQKLWHRVFELYCYAMGIIVVILAARIVLPRGYEIWWNWLGDTSFADPSRLLAIMTFVFQPTIMDILPQYIIYMIFSPMLIWLCLQGKWRYVVLGSVIVWMAGQLGLHRVLTGPLDTLAKGADGQGVRASFNLLGWQIVFISGLVLGTLTADRKIDWQRIFSPEKTFLPKAALAICLFFAPLRILTAYGLMPKFMLEKFSTMEIRADFGPVYLVNFAAVAVGLAWLLIAGPRHHSVAVQRIAAAVAWVFSLRFLRFLGRHSLYVYVWHVVIVYAVYYVDGRTPVFSQFTKTLIALVSIAFLSLPAVWRERNRILPPNAAAKAAGAAK
ncbi:hypothetical protein OPIT5_09265 [Opitutaceae bacterium TAV5]|nr:hypothetical protein OPIT5_09265 [Opitutaceae bacterium TAV5]